LELSVVEGVVAFPPQFNMQSLRGSERLEH
jgi:hypothetical protein